MHAASGGHSAGGRCGLSARGRGFFQGVHHGLAHRDAGPEARAYASGTPAFIGCGDRDGLCDLVLRVPAHVADHVHADALIEHFLQLVGKRKILDDEAVECEAEDP